MSGSAGQSHQEGDKLLVPIRIEALAVGKTPPRYQFQWSNPSPNFAKLQDDYYFGSELGGERGTDGNPFNEAASLPQGIHLHFRLPRALTRGHHEGGGDVEFPYIPNRWLVQRYYKDTCADKWGYNAWLVRSDGDNESTGITWATQQTEDGPIKFIKVGFCKELTSEFKETVEPKIVEIRAVGPGDPAFSAFYPACQGILGFHDPLTNVPATEMYPSQLSYLVIGWYSDPKDDFLTVSFEKYFKEYSETNEISTEKNSDDNFKNEVFKKWIKAWSNEQGWIIGDPKNDEIPEGLTRPSGILFHGLVRKINWVGPQENYMQPFEKLAGLSQPAVFALTPEEHIEAHKIGIGNNPSEAMAALLTPGEIEQDLLAALHDDVVSRPVTTTDLLYELHERRFTSIHGGALFQIRHEESQTETPGENDAHRSAGARPIPAELRKLLNELNEIQRKCDWHSFLVEDWRQKVYMLWHLWTRETRNSKRVGNETGAPRVILLEEKLDKAQKHLNAEIQNWKQAVGELQVNGEELKKTLESRKFSTEPEAAATKQEVSPDNNPKPLYRATLSSANPFFMPNDPGIAIQGPSMSRNNSDQPADVVSCRTTSQVIIEITVQVPARGSDTVKADDLFTYLEMSPLSGIHRKLLGEALLLDKQLVSDIVELIGKKGAQDQNKQNLAVPDRTAMFDWAGNPWIPLFLVWEVLWHSDYEENSLQEKKLMSDLWRLEDNVAGGNDCDLAPGNNEQKKYDLEKASSCVGCSILTPSSAENLAKRFEDLAGTHPIVNSMKNVKMQTIMLDGFNDHLILQQPVMHLPPLDFKNWYRSEEKKEYVPDSFMRKIKGKFIDLQNMCHKATIHNEPDITDLVNISINRNLEEQYRPYRTVPGLNDNPFFPIRSGRLKIKRLSVIDAFGQTLKLPVEEINESVEFNWQDRLLRRAHSCMLRPSQPDNDASIALRPRFDYPMRLRFAWETGSTENGPVCGWILPNHMDQSLMVYSADGKPLGALQKKLNVHSKKSAKAFYWWKVPQEGANRCDDVKQENIEKYLHENIKNVHLRYFCNWVLKLDLDDVGAVIDKAMASTDHRVPEDDPGASILIGRPLALVRASLRFETSGLPAHPPESLHDHVDGGTAYQQLKWPLRLGDLHSRNDGLIGLFLCKDGMTEGNFYPVWGQQINNDAHFALQDFKIDAIRPLHVTMLMDPHARVHATTGVLPRTSIELPHEILTGANRVREVFFQTAPVLGIAATPEMPRPSDEYGEWSWAYRPDVTGWKVDPNIVEATDRASFPGTWPTLSEGLLKLVVAPVRIISFWSKEPENATKSGERTLIWSQQGAEEIHLKRKPENGEYEEILRLNKPPFQRTYKVSVEATTLFLISVFAEGELQDFRELKIKIVKD